VTDSHGTTGVADPDVRVPRTVLVVAAIVYVLLMATAHQRTAHLFVRNAGADGDTRNQPDRPPRTHTFNAGPYRHAFSAAFAPVLHLNPGDTVRTATLDNLGVDANGITQSSPPNPQTGPFFIEGARPGDTLAVTLNAVELNRDFAHSYPRVASFALTADYARRLRREEFDASWRLDREHGVAMLLNPSAHLKDLRVKVRPMLGGLGVAAPDDQAPLATMLGAWGGNLDYAAVEAGTTMYFPVYHPGALLFLGDGHAFQGDGELTGAAIETSLDVEFTVAVVKGQAIEGPRAENAEFIMAMGIGETFPVAFRRATTSLLTWLERDYQLTSSESAMVLGAALRYDVAEIVDPQVHIVAKLPKAILPPRQVRGTGR
jgi:amidase